MVFDEKRKASECLTHEFGKLIDLAGLTDQLNADLKTSAAAGGELASNWNTAKAWAVTSRYEAKTEADAGSIYDAITGEPGGVLRWIRTYW